VIFAGPSRADISSVDKRLIGGGLRLASGAAAPRLDHGYFEVEARPMLGSILLKKGWITNDKLDAALEAARISGMRLGETLLARGWLFEPELAAALAEQFGLRYVDLVRHPLDSKAARLLPLEVARRRYDLRVRCMESGVLEVAVGDPSDADADALEQVLGRRVELVVGERSVIQDAWRYLR
jgi:hypothetical protein